MALPIGLQLYTVRDVLAKDFDAGMKQVADAGYRHVELAGLYGRTPEQAKALCDKLGLAVLGTHASVDAIRDKPAEAIEQARLFGYKYVTVSSMPADLRTSAAGYRDGAKRLQEAGRLLKDAGLTLCYHNHSFEWQAYENGIRGIDIIFQDSDPTLVHSQLDVYWAQHGGDDPLDWMYKLSGRVPLLHIKDMDNTADRNFTEVGTGILDMQAIVNNAAGVGAKYLIVEQDRNWKGNDPIASVKISFDNLSRMVKKA
jgi:sugar phosphate isomerase/epimerase